ncbi:hypothetical protein L3Y34_008430 [Caenorhabditis briggsae]|uniref:Uncharacterized protein n=1 Tax=Caenorhabditis briggsae TaxID=6238 RepID=A0AAE9D063_CAEBR|nr:hypothetical protein L3Y34_008430 [Caenorhabditis briggsae]
MATKLALINYVKRLEKTSNIEIVPKHLENPWSYNIFNKLCRLIVKKIVKKDRDQAKDIICGWEAAYKFHVKGWTQNDLSVEDVKFLLPFVFRFIDIVVEELNLNNEMVTYVQDNLFTININEIAAEIYEESNRGKITQLLQNLKMRKDLLVKLNVLYKSKYGEDLADVLFRSKDELKKFLGIKVML